MKKKINTAAVPVHCRWSETSTGHIRLVADEGWKLRSKQTGHAFRVVKTAHVEGWEPVTIR